MLACVPSLEKTKEYSSILQQGENSGKSYPRSTSGLFMAAVPFFCASSGFASLLSFDFRTTVINFAYIKHLPQQVLLLPVNGTSL